MTEHSTIIIFICVSSFTFCYISCLAPETRGNNPVLIKSAGDASLSFIAGEAGSPKSNFSPLEPSRGNIRYNTAQTVTNYQPQNVNQKISSNTQSSMRDYVNPSQKLNQPLPGTTATQAPESPSRDFVNTNLKPGESIQPVTPQVIITRDYINPNLKPGGSVQPSNSSPTQNPLSNPRPDTQKSSVRDYVNPNIKPRDPFPALPPSRGIKHTSVQGVVSPPTKAPTRDFINTSLKPISSHTAPQSSIKDYINPAVRPRDPFPTLKPVGQVAPTTNRQQAPNAKPNLSYAQRASGGVTTTKPGPAAISLSSRISSTGTPNEQATEKADDGPNDNELREFSEALLKKDVNNAFKHVTLNIQGKTTSQSKNDEAPQRLLEINSAAYQIPTIAKIRPLYNNYILDVTQNEHVTPQEKAEENDLIETIAATPVMQHTRNLLIEKGKVSKDPKDFKDLLKTIWFSMYSRGMGRVGSSGFEHIFLAEIKKEEVTGLHNWLYFHEVEQNNLANYLGYMKKIDLGEKGAILKFHFTLDGKDKPVSSIFIGTSPEFEMALYTTCYMFRANRICPLRLNGKNFIVRAYANKYRGKNILGSAFPEI